MAITTRALSFVTRWFDEATVRRTFEPLIADWERELLDTPPSRRVRVSAGGLAAFICAVIVTSPSLLHTLAPSAVTNRVALRMTRFIALASVLLMLPFFRQMLTPGWRAVMLFSLVSSAIAVAFPLSMIGAVDAIRRYDPLPPHVERAVAAKLGLIAVVFMLVFGGFVVPASNQLFRQTSGPGGPSPFPGVRELTTYQLLTDPALEAHRAANIQRELNNRAALALFPVVLLWVRWRAIDTGRGTWWSPLPAPLATMIVVAAFVVTSFYGFFLELDLDLAAGTRHWLPIAAFTVWGLTTALRRRVMPPIDQIAADMRDRWRASRCP
jgi:hypothetical protein